MSQHLCERMGGELGLESVAGVGSTFVVELPMADPARSAGPDRGACALAVDETDGRDGAEDGRTSDGKREREGRETPAQQSREKRAKRQKQRSGREGRKNI